MTANQTQAHWELCRQGFPLEADQAAQQWDRGQPFEFHLGVRLARSVEALIQQCNWEVQRTGGAA